MLGFIGNINPFVLMFAKFGIAGMLMYHLCPIADTPTRWMRRKVVRGIRHTTRARQRGENRSRGTQQREIKLMAG